MIGRAPRARDLDIYTDFPFARLDEQEAFVLKAEDAGYSGVWATENRHDPFLPTAAAARPHRRLTIGPGVTALLARSPFAVAQMSWDLHYNSGENFILGVGTQTDEHLIGRFGISAADKYHRIKEAIALIRELWSCWQERRPAHYRGKYYSIDVCPEGYRPTTALTSLPKIYYLCTTLNDVDVASECADGIFLHPTWPPGLIKERFSSWPAHVPVIDGSIIATGATDADISKSRTHARWRLLDYWCKEAYDDVFRSAGLFEEIAWVRAEQEQGTFNWETPAANALYEQFCCDAALDDLPDSLWRRHSDRTSGIFPNIMSLLPRLLPPQIVRSIRWGSSTKVRLSSQ